ncbi:hypothetical protein V5O39_07205 [Pseudomonas parakoreensis]
MTVARQLLPLTPAPVSTDLARMRQNLQRMQPAFSDKQAMQVIEALRSDGATDVQIAERITGWSQTFETLVRRLNGWLYTRETRGADWVISSQSRSLAAWRILTCWRARLAVAGAMRFWISTACNWAICQRCPRISGMSAAWT